MVSTSAPRPGIFLYRANLKCAIFIGIRETSTHLPLQRLFPRLSSHSLFFFLILSIYFLFFFMQRRLKSQKSHLHPAASGSLCSHAAAPACFSEDEGVRYDHRCYLSRRSSAFCVFLIRIPHFIPRKTTGVTCRREGGTSKAPGAGPGWASQGQEDPVPHPGGRHWEESTSLR